jgi:hypothetical protein
MPSAQEPKHRRILAPIIRAQAAEIRAEDRLLKAHILVMPALTPFAEACLHEIKDRENAELLLSLGLGADEGQAK